MSNQQETSRWELYRRLMKERYGIDPKVDELCPGGADCYCDFKHNNPMTK